jgi:hypothetical protein
MGTSRTLEPPRTSSSQLQHLWLSLVRRPWSSLVLVPVDPGTSVGWIAAPLPELGRLYGLGPFELLSAEGLSAAEGARLADGLDDGATNRARAVVTVEAPAASEVALRLVLAADAAVLVVRRGGTSLEEARSLIDQIGCEQVLGAVVT